MPKQLIKRYLPDHRTFREHKRLRCLGKLLQDPNVWHLNRRSVSGAFSVGLFVAFMPIPMQMLVAAVVAIGSRVNLPLSVCMVWITNPVTIPAMFFFAYKLGAWMLGIQAESIAFELSFAWLSAEFAAIWQPLLLGCVTLGTISAILGNLTIRLLWRLHIFRYIQRRRLKRPSPNSR